MLETPNTMATNDEDPDDVRERYSSIGWNRGMPSALPTKTPRTGISRVGSGQSVDRGQSIDRNSFLPLIASGSKGMLGYVLEKMHKGQLLSQHEVSAGLREYNQMKLTIAELEHKTKNLRLQVTDEEAVGIKAPPTETGKPTKTVLDPGSVIMSKAEKNRLLGQIERKQRLIDELKQRLKALAQSKTKVKNVLVSDVAPPAKLVDEFCDIYEKEWSHTYEALKASWKDKERVIYTLFRIVRHAYVFCFDIAETQRNAVDGFTNQLQEIMLHPHFYHPVSKLRYKASAMVGADTQKYTETGRDLIGEYRNILVSQSIPGVQELFTKVKLPEIFESGFVTKGVQDFVNRVVQVIWLMVVQDPPMMVYWLEPGRAVLPEYFNYFDDKAALVKYTVWPAIFLKEQGAILSKGVVLATDSEDFDDLVY